MSNDVQGGIQMGNVTGNVSLQAGGDIVAGNKTVIQNIVQEAVKKITTSPYKFLASYDISDRDIFYGRSVVIEKLVGEVPRHKTLIINGASGSGKSSLINAGLIPRLAENGYTYVSFREYSDPLQQLRDYLSSQKLAYLIESGELEKISQDAPLLELLRLFKTTQNTNLVVIFDQFERFLVNVSPEKRRAFIEALKQCMASNLTAQEMNFLFVLRQDFFGQMLAEIETVIPNFLNESAHFNLQPLSQAEAREAIIHPLEELDVKIRYDEDFVDEILLTGLVAHSAEHSGINPPHLQIVCNQLYESAHQGLKQKSSVIINAKLYNELGGAQTILQTYLDRVVEDIAHDPEKMAIVRSMLKAMIATVGTRKFVSLEDLRKSLPDVVEMEVIKFLEKLREQRVIEVRQPRYSLSHEFMVEKVRSWFDEREMVRQKALESLERGVAEWQTSEALLNEKQVNNIRKWLADFTEDEQQLLIASEKAYTERKHREEEQKRQLKAARKRTIIVGAVATVFIIAVSLSFGILSHYAKIETENVKKERTLDLFESQLTHASLLTQGEDYAKAHAVLTETYPLDKEVPVSYRHARNLLDRSSQMLGSTSQQVYQGADEQLETIAISPDGLSLVAGGEKGALVVFDTKTGQIRQRLKGHLGTAVDAVFHPQNQWLATVEEYDTRIVFWSLLTGKPIDAWPTSEVVALAINVDGTYLASGSENNVILWDIETNKPQRTLIGHEESISKRGLTFHPTKPLLVSVSEGGIAFLWNVHTGEKLQQFKKPNDKTSITFSPDGKFIAAGCYDKSVCLWEIDSSKKRVLNGHKNQVLAVHFVANGHYLVSASLDRTLRFWDVESGSALRVLQGHTGGVSAIATYGKQLFSASYDGTVMRWDTNSSYQQSIALQNKNAFSSAMTPDGTRIAVGFRDGSLHFLFTIKCPFIVERRKSTS
jgi:WD40 repeat protein